MRFLTNFATGVAATARRDDFQKALSGHILASCVCNGLFLR